MGVLVSVMHVADVIDVHGFDAVVVGSPMATGEWSKEASRFVRRNSEALGRVPFWLFSSGSPGTQAEPSHDEIDEFEKAIDPIVRWLQSGADDITDAWMPMPRTAKGHGIGFPTPL